MKRRSCYLFAGTLLILICVICGETKDSRHSHTNTANVSNSDSCETSPVRRNVTLRGGIKAGYFHKLAQYVAMELCVQLCCQEKGCDVAFMIGKNCYGVKCFSEELCHVVPANNAPRALMISKVDFRGEVYIQKFMPERLKCFQTSVEHNVTLKGGLQAGNFTAVGHVEDIDACAKLCCVRDGCDLALVVNNHCFMVNCLIEDRCRSTPVMNKQFRTHVARVNRTKVIAKEQQAVRALSSSPGKTSKLMCKNGIVQYNRTLLGGYDAGKYKLLSHSTNMSVCIRLCCGEMTCDVAFMIERKCYGVVCKTLRLCETIPAKTSIMLNHLSPQISFITSRNEEVNSVILQRQSEICKSNVISYDVTLRGGRHAGKYKAFGPVDDMEECIRVCCMQRFCDLAFVINGTCFTVRCHTEEDCQEVRSPGSGFKPMISYVVRERPHGYHKNSEQVHGKKFKKKYHQKGDQKVSKNTSSTEMPEIPSPSLPSVDSEHYCTNSEIMYNVTLRGGITSGTFRDRGVLPNMQECLRICCIAKSCDLAFMLSKRCFSVTCKNQTLCEVVTARSSGYKPQIAYIYARSNVTNHDLSGQTHSQDQSSESTSTNEISHPNQKSNNIIPKQSSDKHKKKNRKVKKFFASKHKKKLFKTKKPRRRKKHKRKMHQSNQAKLKRLYAEERILLRKLALLKLRMEMIKRRDREGNESTKDNVLLEAFEDEPKTSKTTLYEEKNSRPRITNKTKGTNENTAAIRTKHVMGSNTTNGATDTRKKESNKSKPFIRKDERISLNGNTFTTKEKQLLYDKDAENNFHTENKKLFQNDTFSERKFLPHKTGNTSNIFPSFKKNRTSHSLQHPKKQIAKEVLNAKTTSNLTNSGLSKFQNISFKGKVSQAKDDSQTNSKGTFNVEVKEKQTKLNIEKTSFEKTKEFYNGKKVTERKSNNNTASLEEMISQTTGSKDREFKQALSNNRNRRKNRTYITKKLEGNNDGNPQKDGVENFVNIVQSTPVANTQSKDTRHFPKNISPKNGLISKGQNSFTHQQETTNDPKLLDAFSFKTRENNEQKWMATPVEKHFNVPKNSSKKGDNS